MANEKLDSVMEKLDNVEEKVSDIRTKLEVHLSKFDAHIELEREQNQILNRNTEILQTNTASLQDHMARTDLLESYVKQLDQRIAPVEMELLRSNAVADWWKARVMFLAKLGGAIAAVSTMLGLLKWLLNAD
jgi:DNA repair exonuclease SbcCD ATPase subunit